MNRRISVVIERRNPDPNASEPWVTEEGFIYDPNTLSLDGAIDMRPKIDHAEKALWITGDYLDYWMRPRIKERAESGEKK